MNHTERKSKILIVDDTPENIQILMETLKREYTLVAAINGPKALELAEKPPLPDLVLLDIMMPGMDGYEVCKKLKANPFTNGIPVIFVTAMNEEEDEARGLALGAVDYIAKPFIPALVKARVKNHLALKHHQDQLTELVKERTKELFLTREVTIESLASLAETRDPETGGHIIRTQNYVKLLAQEMSSMHKYRDFLDPETIEHLYLSAPLHDIGKVGVADGILLKPGKLTEAEFNEMKNHTLYGYKALAKAVDKLGSNSFLRFAREIAYTHQEKWDGSGYPQGLTGEEIPLSGRIMALADVYDALISRRVYKPPFPHSKAKGIIKEGKGSHFDPDVVTAFVAQADNFRKIAYSYADTLEEKETLMAET